MTGYTRDAFGPAWSDDNDEPFGHNGCDTRDDVLRRDINDPVIEAGTGGCVVLDGTLDDPYTATRIPFQRGETTSDLVQIDHVVALGDAWQTGARRWPERRRQDLGNDPLDLLAVDGSQNESKGDADAAGWLPPNRAFQCRYVARQVAVKKRYGLWVTPAEHAAMAAVLARCPGQRLPVEPGAVGSVVTHAARAPPTGSRPRQGPGRGVYYANCDAARAAGAAPIYRGQPGYRPELDGDDDGIACE